MSFSRSPWSLDRYILEGGELPLLTVLQNVSNALTGGSSSTVTREKYNAD